MTTIASASGVVTGGVDTHLDTHVAAVVDHLGAVLGTAAFPTTPDGYRRLTRWVRGHGLLDRVGVEGTGSYGAGLARHLAREQVTWWRWTGRTVRCVAGTARPTPWTRSPPPGPRWPAPRGHPEVRHRSGRGIRALRLVIRSAHKARTQATNQLHNLVLTAPEELRQRLRGTTTRSSWLPALGCGPVTGRI